ncbi:add-1 family protein [Megaselia abdita]
MTEVEQPPQNGIDLPDPDDSNIIRPADIEQDMREMERRKRVEAIMESKLFREELERIVDSQIKEGGASGILQQLSDIVGVPASRVGSVFKSSNCVVPINDIRGIESMGYDKGEKILRCKLAATFRLLDLYGWTQGLGAQITARLNADQELFLVNPYGLLFHEVTASSLNKVDMQGQVVEQGTTNFGINKNQYQLHAAVHAARPDLRCAIYLGCNAVVAISSIKSGVLPLTKDAALLGEVARHTYSGLSDAEENEKLVRDLGPNSKVLLLSNHGALCCGETVEEAFFAAYHIIQACETQLKLLPVGIDNLVLLPEEKCKQIYDESRRPPEHVAALLERAEKMAAAAGDKTDGKIVIPKPKWRVGGAEFEALMRMLDNAGFRTGYIYRHPLVKSELPKPKNDVELPPAVSSLGYLLEEEELYRQGIWKKGVHGKTGDRTRWLNSPNVYQKVEVLETGTPDPKKITKWVADSSPIHSTPVKIDHPLQFVPTGTSTKEFKRVQQQIKDNRRADKISAGPQSHILEGVTWDEANRLRDQAIVSAGGDQVVLMGAASKGIIQRGYQHNATVYSAPYAKNPFDNVTDDELNEYKRTIEKKKKSIHGEYTDTDFSESEALSSLQISAPAQKVCQSEPEDASGHQVMRIETKQAPKPSQPEVVLSDVRPSTIINKINQEPIKAVVQTKSRVRISKSFFREALLTAQMSLMRDKYDYLYKYPNSEKFIVPSLDTSVFVIQKIPGPTTCDSSRQPYRTLSHFGFNVPQITPPQLYQPFPENDLDEDNASVHISSQECMKNMNLEMKFISVKEIHIDESEDCGASGESLAMPLKNRLSFEFVSDPESENNNTRVVSTVKKSLKRIYRNSSMSEEEEFDDVGHHKAVDCKATIPEENEQCCHINVNIEVNGFGHPEFVNKGLYCEKIANLLQVELAKSNFKLSVSECKQKILENIKDIENCLNDLKIE